MKKIILSCALAISTYTYASTCSIIIPQRAGGATDVVARVMQRHNNNIIVDYKPSAYAATAISHADKNPSIGILAYPMMYSKNNPDQNPNVDVIKIFGAYDHGIVTNKNISFSDILKKKLNVGISFIGSPAHVIGEQLKAKNQQLELIAFGGDANAYAAVRNGDVDVYISALPNIEKWSNEQGFKVLSRIPAIGNTVQEGVTMTNVSRFGIFMSKNASEEQRQNMLKCINDALNSKTIKSDFKAINLNMLNEEGKEANKTIQFYNDILRYYGI